MKTKNLAFYICLVFLSFLLLILPQKFSDSLRSKMLFTVTPIWKLSKKCFAGPSLESSSRVLSYNPKALSKMLSEERERNEKLSKDHLLLSEQISQVKEYLSSSEHFEKELENYRNLEADTALTDEGFIKRRKTEFFNRLKYRLFSVGAKVVYREPISWGSFLWIDVGSKHNQAIGANVVAENSPVVIGNVIVGVIEQVEKTKSKVRLITDEKLVVAVRAIRGSEQNKALLERLETLTDLLRYRNDVFFSEEEQNNTLQILDNLKTNSRNLISERYFAKGELHGSSEPLWRCRSLELKGEGFNYDFADLEGPARDLRTGKTQDKAYGEDEVLLKQGDLLVTTGLDGVFPEGFHVAVVSFVDPLKEGGVSYSLKAKALFGHIDEISYVSVLPPREGFFVDQSQPEEVIPEGA